MKTGFAQFLGMIPMSVLPNQIVPADVAPPPEAVATLAVGFLLAIGVFVVIIVFFAFLVIRAIRKKNTSKKNGI
jgi:hypothetical protein